jgi:hypothetical protein
MNKSAFARELGARLDLRMSRQMLDKYHVRGMPLDAVDSAIAWLAMNSIGEPGQRADELSKRDATRVATSQPSGATLQPDDDCGALKPDQLLTLAAGPNFYREDLAAADIVQLSQLLQARVPQFAQCPPAMAEAVRRAIREAICAWSGGEACPRCRRAVGIIEPPEPDGEPETRAA